MIEVLSKRSLAGVVLALMLAVCAMCLGACASQEAVAAKVGDTVITEAEVTEYTADFRTRNGLQNDADWSSYLSGVGLTAKTWREQVIGTKSERILIEQKAKQLGITADESLVDKEIESDIGSYGGREQYEAALAAAGTTEEEQRETYRFANIEQQVLMAELDIDDQVSEQMAQEFIESSLADRVLRRYSVIVFDSAHQTDAQACLDELKGLQADALTQRFAQMARERSIDEASAARDGDAGWNFGYTLRNGDEYVTLDEGQLYDKLFEVLDENGSVSKYEILLCTKKFAFESGVTYADIDEEDLKAYVLQQASTAHWSSLMSDYINKLREEAQVQVHAMPSGLPYDVQ